MYYIDDISYRPWSMIDFRKYQLYLEMRKHRDKFLKSLKETSYLDWQIDKRLIEAGGLGKTVYILPARGGGTSFRTLKKINDFLEEGRDVTLVRPNKNRVVFDSWNDIPLDLFDQTLQGKIYAQFTKHLISEYEKKLTQDPVFDMEWKPIVRPDAYIYNTPRDYLYQWRLLNEFGQIYRTPEGETQAVPGE